MYAPGKVVDDEVGYEVNVRSVTAALSDRRGSATSRQLSGQERRSQQSRHDRRPTPTRVSGNHRRCNKHTGL